MKSIRNKALQLLGRRDHSYCELQQKLEITFADQPAEEIKAVMDDFVELGWISDARFAEQWVYYRSQRYGPQRLKHELIEKGVATEIIEQALLTCRDDEAIQAQHILRRKFSMAPKTHADRTKQLRFLANKGFNLNIVYQVVGELQQEEFD